MNLAAVALSDLWLCVLLGGVAVFLMSFVLRMVLKYHWSDYGRLPNEDAVRDAIRETGVGGGQYVFPHCSGAEAMKDPEYMASYERGPSGFLVLQEPGSFSFGKPLALSFCFNIAVSLLAAWMAVTFLDEGADATKAGLFTGLIGFLSFSASNTWGPIWKSEPWCVWGKEIFDGAVYGAAMGGIFFWLGPWGAA
jgi:hypothetical protein